MSWPSPASPSGQAAEAEDPARKALAIREKSLPADHPDLAESNERLAAVLRKIGKNSEAEAFDRKAKEIRRKHAESNPPPKS
jgi:hypothetical protein